MSFLIVVAMTLTLHRSTLFVTSLQKRLRKQMNEYFNLINRMREGVLVLTKDLKGALEIQFCNKTVEKLFKASKGPSNE